MDIAFIDAGFLKAAGARALGVQRRDVDFKPRGVVNWVTTTMRSDFPAPAARVYWYDGALDPGHSGFPAQRRFFDAIANTPGVQIRLGHLKSKTPPWHQPLKAALRKMGVDLAEFEAHFPFRQEFEQKGVDTLMVLDIVRLAERKVFETAVLIAGDRDLAEAVRVAQDTGRRIFVAYPEGAGVAGELRQLADALVPIPKQEVAMMLNVKATTRGDTIR